MSQETLKHDLASQLSTQGQHPRVRIIPAKLDLLAGEQNTVKKFVAAYARVSTGYDEQQSSYDLQVDYYTRYIKSNPEWQFAGVFADEGISAVSTSKRVEFNRMIELCKQGKINHIITKSISRFARNTLDCLKYIRMLKSLNPPVGIFFEKENIFTLDSRSELLLTILSSLAQDESRSTSENVRWAIQKRYQQGIAKIQTKFLLGYDTDENGNMVIVPEEAEIVKRIYNEFLSGRGVRVIANGLMADGIKTSRNKDFWYDHTVLRVLKNEKNYGAVLWNKQITIDFMNRKRLENDRIPKYYIHAHHEPIIDKAEWDAVQAELNRRARTMTPPGSKVKVRFSSSRPMSNRLFCGYCGEPLTRKKNTSTHGNVRTYYPMWRCRAADGKTDALGECSARSYRESSIAHAFMDLLQNLKRSKFELEADARDAIKVMALEDWEMERLDSIADEMKILEIKLSEAAVNARPGRRVSDIYDDVSIRLSYEIENLKREWSQLSAQLKEFQDLEEHLNWFLRELDTIEEFDPTTQVTTLREDIYHRIVERGTAYDDGRIVYEFVFGVKRTATGNDNKSYLIGMPEKPKQTRQKR